MSQRLFIGVALDEPTRAALGSALDLTPERLAPATLRWLPAASWHFTLAFLGAVAEQAVPSVQAACARAADSQHGFDLALSRAGAFGSTRVARVLWIGVSRGAEQMTALHEAVIAQTEPLGFARDERAYSPHLTIARLKRAASVESLITSMRLPALSMHVSELTLFRSHLSQQGSRYEVVARYPLSGTAPKLSSAT